MRLLLLVVGAIMLLSVNSVAQGVGAIVLCRGENTSICDFSGNPSGAVETVHVFHSFHGGVTASNFKIQDIGTNWTWIVDQPQGGTTIVGNTRDGGLFAYGGCITTEFNFVNVLYATAGTAGPCSSLEVVPNPASLTGTIEGVNCDDIKLVADGSRVFVNCTVPVEETTWGAVKALYGN